MGGFVQGAALGAAIELLFRLLLDAIYKAVCLSSDLNRLTSTLSSIKRVVDDTHNFNTVCDESFNDRLIEIDELIQKCSKFKWNIFSMWYYSMKLNKLEAQLLNSFLQINVVAVSHSRESERISVIVSNVDEKVDEFTIMMNNREIGGGISNSFSENFDGIEEGGYCGGDP
ncbi:hypothetical protein BUALT_Bualt01G0221300 [Buddleja alternifolia]|uniref:RPW8 domain-containing protein n=1 Tax=Buddleja alternifolia TaxID=168488 RepID=A0AAV6YBI5_9LAMI|nr:hypothetical protein BUALT_Bualt01G0221300 [Buddleja alternifolia]